MDEEKWLVIEGFPNYEISNFGRVKNIKRNRILKVKENNGYYFVCLCNKYSRKEFRVHILVIRAFIGVKPDRCIVNHKDGNKVNNHIDNLEYITPSENNCHHIDNFGKRGIKLTKDDVLKIVELLRDKTMSQSQIAVKFNVNKSRISSIKLGRTWQRITGFDYIPEIKRSQISRKFILKYPELSENEIWKDVVGYENLYQISNMGRVWSLCTGKFKSFDCCCYYFRTSLFRRDHKNKHYFVHVLVAEAFIGTKPDGYVINHKDGNKLNNRVSNLEYITLSENVRHSLTTLGNSKLSIEDVRKIRELLSQGKSCQSIAVLFNIHRRSVYQIKNKETWKHLAV